VILLNLYDDDDDDDDDDYYYDVTLPNIRGGWLCRATHDNRKLSCPRVRQTVCARTIRVI
jgi:hypothetical protein